MSKHKLKHIKSTKNSYKVPTGYFDTIEDDVMAKITAEKFPKKEGFSSPGGYLDNLEDTILKKIKKEKTHQYAKQTGFNVPENYLKSVEDTIITKLNADAKPIKVISLKTIILKRITPLAAAAAVLLLIYFNYNSKTVSFDSLASTDIEQWIENDLITFDTYEIADIYKDTELESPDLFTEDENDLLDYLNGTDIESLLLEN